MKEVTMTIDMNLFYFKARLYLVKDTIKTEYHFISKAKGEDPYVAKLTQFQGNANLSLIFFKGKPMTQERLKKLFNEVVNEQARENKVS